MSKIDFVYFDIGNVLLLFSGGLQKLAKKHCKQYEDFEKVFLKYDDLVCRGNMSPLDLWKKYKEELELDEENIDFAEYWTSNFVLIKESFNLISEIKEAKIKVGLFSNIYSGIFDKLVEKDFFPFMDWDSKIFSCDVGFVKPEEDIYKIAEIAADVEPKRILFTDDKQDFLNPAKDRGWQVFCFDPKEVEKSIKGIREFLYDN